jgi:hypothetical protein
VGAASGCCREYGPGTCRRQLSQETSKRCAKFKTVVQRMMFTTPHKFVLDKVGLHPMFCLVPQDAGEGSATVKGFLALRVAGLIMPSSPIFVGCEHLQHERSMPPSIGNLIRPIWKDPHDIALWTDTHLRMMLAASADAFKVFSVHYEFLDTDVMKVLGTADISEELHGRPASKSEENALDTVMQHVLNFGKPSRKRKAAKGKSHAGKDASPGSTCDSIHLGQALVSGEGDEEDGVEQQSASDSSGDDGDTVTAASQVHPIPSDLLPSATGASHGMLHVR